MQRAPLTNRPKPLAAPFRNRVANNTQHNQHQHGWARFAWHGAVFVEPQLGRSGWDGVAGPVADARAWSLPSSHSVASPARECRYGRAKRRGMAGGQGAESRRDSSYLRLQTGAGKQPTETSTKQLEWPPLDTCRSPQRSRLCSFSVSLSLATPTRLQCSSLSGKQATTATSVWIGCRSAVVYSYFLSPNYYDQR